MDERALMTAQTAAATNTVVATEIVAAAASAIAAARPTIAGCGHPPPRWPRLAVYQPAGRRAVCGAAACGIRCGHPGAAALLVGALPTTAAVVVAATRDALGEDGSRGT